MAAGDRFVEATRPAALVPLRPRDAETEAPLHDPRLSDVDEWGRSEHMRAVARQIYGPLYRQWFRVEWQGLEKVPTSGGALGNVVLPRGNLSTMLALIPPRRSAPPGKFMLLQESDQRRTVGGSTFVLRTLGKLGAPATG